MKRHRILYFEVKNYKKGRPVYVEAFCEGGYRECVGEFKTLGEAESFMLELLNRNEGAVIASTKDGE